MKTTSPKKIAKALRKELGYHPNDVRHYETNEVKRKFFVKDKSGKIVTDKKGNKTFIEKIIKRLELKDTCSRFFYQQEKQIRRSATNG